MKAAKHNHAKSFRIFMGIMAGVAFIVAMTSPDSGAQAAELVKVPSKQVCMINDEFMSRDQIPVEVDGKMYYGCCQACYSALKTDVTTHYAIDPVSGSRVDKALAVIGALPSGRVFYFESEENLRAYGRKTDDTLKSGTGS